MFPKAIGPYDSHKIIRGVLITSGQLPIDGETNKLVKNNIIEQTYQVMENIKNILENEDYKLYDVIKSTVYLNDMDNFDEFNNVYRKYFTNPYPVRTCVEVSKLPQNALVEIEVMAYKPT